MSVYFKVGGVDYSKYVLADGSYKINKVDYYNDVRDGNGVTHRNVYKRSVEGTFSMKFPTAADYTEFVQRVEAARTAGAYVSVQVQSNNTMSNESINAFVTIEPARERDDANRDYFGEFTVTVEEI